MMSATVPDGPKISLQHPLGVELDDRIGVAGTSGPYMFDPKIPCSREAVNAATAATHCSFAQVDALLVVVGGGDGGDGRIGNRQDV